MLRACSIVLFGSLIGAATAAAQTTCADGGSPSWKGLNLIQTDCQNWKDGYVPPSGQIYAALQFHFVLKSKPVGSAESRSVLDALKSLVTKDDAQEIALSVLPKIGNYDSVETPIYTYVASKPERTFGTSGQFEFTTPYIRYDQQPLSFVLKARATSKADHDIKGLIDRVQPIIATASPNVWLVSEAAKPALNAVADVTDTVLDAYYNSDESTTASFSLGDEAAAGVVKRVLTLKSGQGDADIGSLTVSLKMRRSIIAGNSISSDRSPKDLVVDYSTVGGILGYQLPAIGDKKNTILGSFASDDGDLKILSAVAYEKTATTGLSDACRQLRTIGLNTFGFNDIDTARMIYELLSSGEKSAAYTEESSVCFSKSDWQKISVHHIFEPLVNQTVPTKDRIEYFATGLRRGMTTMTIYQDQLEDEMEQVEDMTGDNLLPSCTGYNIAKSDLISCLDTFHLNRYQIETSEESPVQILVSRRSQVGEVANAGTRSGVEVVAVGTPVSASTTTKLDYVYRVSLFYSDTQKIRRIKFEKATRASVGDDVTDKLSYPCWVKGKGQPLTCPDLIPPPS
ncbi:hypothetical protein [Rhizobium sp. PEPV16]|uniref:hypothetical protein n=1 Tax=Rhizobium sp. PEPV16 TaxID=1820614 RepID=UPI00124CD14E|nr:hypothetical protein [Rhizobium sp. PEPV16]KAF5880463.1 hypothetical protein FY112_34785 [Rhizobium sp. PEPV16]